MIMCSKDGLQKIMVQARFLGGGGVF